MQGIAAYANQEFMPPGAIADIRGAAEMLERFGREGDVYVVHAAEGETVVPMEVLNSSPNLKKMLFTQMEEMGLSPERYIVGNELNSLNPVTGRPEFFFKNLWKSVRSIFKVAAPILGTMAMTMLLGPGGFGLAAGLMSAGASAAVAGTITSAASAGIGSFAAAKLGGASTKDALKGGMLAAGTAGIFKGFSYTDMGKSLPTFESLLGQDPLVDPAMGQSPFPTLSSVPAETVGGTPDFGVAIDQGFDTGADPLGPRWSGAKFSNLSSRDPLQDYLSTQYDSPNIQPHSTPSTRDLLSAQYDSLNNRRQYAQPQVAAPSSEALRSLQDWDNLKNSGDYGPGADANLLQDLSQPISTVNLQPEAPKVFSDSVDGSDWFSGQLRESPDDIRQLVDKKYLQDLLAAEAPDNKFNDWVARMWNDPGKLPGEVGRYAKNVPGEMVDWVGDNKLRTAMAGGLGYMAYKEAAEAERLAEEEEADRLAGNRAVYDYSQRYRDIGTNAIGYRGKSPSITLTAEHGGAIPGQGQGDIVPAMLEPGEFVMTRNAVTGAGGGSQKDGIKRMYSMMRELEGRV